MIDYQKNPWKTLTDELVYESAWIGVRRQDVINPAGNNGIYSVVHFKNLAIGVLPLDKDYNTWIVGQFRYPVNKYSWEIIEGGGDLQTDPVESAKRELLEETGIKAAKFTQIIELDLSNSATDEKAIVFIAQDLTFHESAPEETEVLEVRKIHFDELFRMVLDGEVTDAISVAAVYKARILIDQGKI